MAIIRNRKLEIFIYETLVLSCFQFSLLLCLSKGSTGLSKIQQMEKATARQSSEIRQVKLFGAIISEQKQNQSTQNTVSMTNLEPPAERNAQVEGGLAPSEEKVHSKRRKAAHARGIKVRRWTEDEHQRFLSGLKYCGKGDWKGISKFFVPSRTPTQVASHAQKYFLAQGSTYRRNYRSSIFDMPVKQSEVRATGNDQCPPETSNVQSLSFVQPLNFLRSACVLMPTTFGNLSTKAPVAAPWPSLQSP